LISGDAAWCRAVVYFFKKKMDLRPREDEIVRVP